MIVRFLLFLVLNFAALGIGSYLMGEGATSDWYSNLHRAPWEPPGYVFGAAWSFIMICFAVYMAIVWNKETNKHVLIGLFALQWLLNVSWNPTFFYYHQVGLALILILFLTSLIAVFFTRYWKQMQLHSMWILPYFLWLLVAISLNAYILMQN